MQSQIDGPTPQQNGHQQNGQAGQCGQQGQYGQEGQQAGQQQGQYAQGGQEVQAHGYPGQQNYHVPYNGQPGQEGGQQKGANRGLILGLMIGGGVLVLALILVLVLFLTGVLGGPKKIESESAMREAVREYAEDHDLDHCHDIEDTPLDAYGTFEEFKVEICSDQDLTNTEGYTGGLNETKVVIGFWTGDTEVSSDQLTGGTSGLWERRGDDWYVVGNVGTSDEAEKFFGGEDD